MIAFLRSYQPEHITQFGAGVEAATARNTYGSAYRIAVAKTARYKIRIFSPKTT